MLIMKGVDLKNFAGWTDKLERRSMFPKLVDHLEHALPQRICVLNGLRRTGKTVMMLQATLLAPEISAYFCCEPGDDLDGLADAMEAVRNEGYKRMFVDEITLLEEFIDGAQFLADYEGAFGKVVISGTDSLGMQFAEHTSLSGRATSIHTTRIPFAEHCRLLGTTTLDDYARSGGILSRVDEFSEYPLEAIALNIQNSLDFYRGGSRYGHLWELREHDLLTNAIQGIIADEGHRFVDEVVKKGWTPKDYTQIRRDLSLSGANKIAKTIKPADLVEQVRYRLGIVSKKYQKVSPEQFFELNSYLQKLDLIEPRIVISENDIRNLEDSSENEFQELEDRFIRKFSFFERINAHPLDGPWLLTQPGLRWAQIDALLKAIHSQLSRKTDVCKNALDFLFKRIRENAMGNIMEEIIVSETRYALNYEKNVFKYRNGDGEIDMVIVGDYGPEIYEIKHSSEARKTHHRHLDKDKNNKKFEIFEQYFGKIQSRVVIYSGKTGTFHDRSYINAADWLCQLGEPEVKIPRPTITFMPSNIF